MRAKKIPAYTKYKLKLSDYEMKVIALALRNTLSTCQIDTDAAKAANKILSGIDKVRG